MEPVNEFVSVNQRRVVVFNAADVQAALGVKNVLAIYKVGDRVEVVTHSDS